LDQSNLLPPLNKIRDYSIGIVIKVGEYLYNEQLSAVRIPLGKIFEHFFKENLFNPVAEYPEQY
jgi:malate dehydrogenase (oxaloacetate-decarboxylating)/malate dehydrogenase (oxaloacetate-decarboxylating)(NADP+)